LLQRFRRSVILDRAVVGGDQHIGEAPGDDDLDGRTSDDLVRDGMTPPAGPRARRKTTTGLPFAAVDSGRIESLHRHPTQQLPSARGLPAGAEGDTRASTSASPVEALRLEEIARTRVFLKVCLVIAAGAIVALGFAGGDPTAKIAVAAGSALSLAASAWFLARTRDPSGYTTRRVVIAATLIAIGAFGGVYFWGVVSPVTALLLFGIYFFGFGASQRLTLYVWGLCAGIHAALTALIILGVIADRGVIRTSDLPLRDQIMSHLVVQFLYGCAYVTARASRKTTLEAVSHLERAVRAVAHREALLAEARLELDRALKVGGAGRYTDQVVGAFRLGTLIGRGGMGEVYDAVHTQHGGEAAVKLLHASNLSDSQHVQRFVREAETAAKLDSPHVVSVLEVGTTAGEIPFIAMERLRGVDLAHHLRRHRRLGLPNVLILVEQIARGLEAARAAGIVHRDVKPHNLFLAERDGHFAWKILDFGVSKLAGHTGTLTRGHVVGTPGYMAPEQARGEEVDHRADLYALSAIAYRCLTGQPPFTAKDIPATLHEVVYRMPPQPSSLVTLPPEVDDVLLIGLAKRADDRFDSTLELAAALHAAASGRLDDDLRHRAAQLAERHPWGLGA
jgi:hypothetical protein